MLRTTRSTTATYNFWTSELPKNGPSMLCFVHFDLQMCFASQRRTIFLHLNFQEWSQHGVLCTFSLTHALRATAAYNFSTSELTKVVRAWCFLYILTYTCTSLHCGAPFFISLSEQEKKSPVKTSTKSCVRRVPLR